jgi:hypothetical protein
VLGCLDLIRSSVWLVGDTYEERSGERGPATSVRMARDPLGAGNALREEHWVTADLLGKAGHIRTIPIPLWVKVAVDAWKEDRYPPATETIRSLSKLR